MEPSLAKCGISGDIAGFFQPQAGREDRFLHAGAGLFQLCPELLRGDACGIGPDKDRRRFQRIQQELPGSLLAVLLHEQPAELLGSRSLRREPFQGREFLRTRAEGFAVPDKGPQYAVDKAAGALLAQLAGEQDALIHSGPFGHAVQEEQLIESHLKCTQYLGVELVHGFAAIGGHNAPQGDLPFQHAIEQRWRQRPGPWGNPGYRTGILPPDWNRQTGASSVKSVSDHKARRWFFLPRTPGRFRLGIRLLL